MKRDYPQSADAKSKADFDPITVFGSQYALAVLSPDAVLEVAQRMSGVLRKIQSDVGHPYQVCAPSINPATRFFFTFFVIRWSKQSRYVATVTCWAHSSEVWLSIE